MKKRICIATSTRADWGILSPLARALRKCEGLEVQILATNMHLIDDYGSTASEITRDGFNIDARVVMNAGAASSDLRSSRALAMAECLSGCARAFESLRPDAIVILGDRYEMLAVAAAATLMLIPIIHIAGGEISEGAIDDSIRHAITKLSSLHLVATEQYRARVIRMGEQPDTVVNTGALGVWNLLNREIMERERLYENLGIDPDAPFIIATFHPVTLDSTPARLQVAPMLGALEQFPDLQVVITYPNNDAGSGEIIEEIEKWGAENSQRAKIIKSLGAERYLSAIRYASFVIGNSSSGIVEVPSVGTPVINIGMRQQGRLHGEAVIDCENNVEAISRAINIAMSEDFRKKIAKSENPYFKEDTLRVCVEAINDFMASKSDIRKRFYDLPDEITGK